MQENKKTRHEARGRIGFWLFLTFGAALLLLAPTSAASPGCLAYAYTSSGNHQFLIGENTSQFGDNVTIVTNCENLTVNVDGELFVQTSRNVVLAIAPGLHNFSFVADGFNRTFDNVMFYPDYLQWESTYQFEVLQEVEYVDASTFDARTNWAVFIGVLVVWILCVYVYWNLINTFVQRNFIEEVAQ